jgi:hypothetical protein
VTKPWIVTIALFAALPAFGGSKHCDRACMIALTDQYLAALVRHDPGDLPLSRGIRFTENTAEIRVGDGLWVGASEAPTTFKIYAVDPQSNQVGFYGVMKENGRPLIIALRLKVVDGEITEIEHVLARNMRPDRMQNLVTPREPFLADVPAGERTSREDMINAANSYFEAIEHGDGEIAPFAEDCERHENGGQTTHNAMPVPWPVPMGSPADDHAMAMLGTLTCTAQVNSQILSFITRLWPRRLGLVEWRDVELAGWRNIQDSRRKDSRDRSHGDPLAVWNQEPVGIKLRSLTVTAR